MEAARAVLIEVPPSEMAASNAVRITIMNVAERGGWAEDGRRMGAAAHQYSEDSEVIRPITSASERFLNVSRSLRLFGRCADDLPFTPSTSHGRNVGVAHLLERIGCQDRSKAAAAVENQLSVPVRDLLFDVTLDDALSYMDRAGCVARGPFAVLPNVHEFEIRVGAKALSRLLHSYVGDGRMYRVNQREKCR
jgi:hypothetical protein